MNQIPDFRPVDQNDWRNWLEANHETEDAIWLILFKKSSPDFNLSWSEAVDEALCFGWIDSTKRPIDDVSYKQYFTRRKEKSNWSKINKEKVSALIDQGRMKEAGLRSIAVAKENGSWTLLDAIEALEIPEDLEKALAKNQAASEFFNGLSKSFKKQLLHWVWSAKRKETRRKRITEVVKSAAKGQKPKGFR